MGIFRSWKNGAALLAYHYEPGLPCAVKRDATRERAWLRLSEYFEPDRPGWQVQERQLAKPNRAVTKPRRLRWGATLTGRPSPGCREERGFCAGLFRVLDGWLLWFHIDFGVEQQASEAAPQVLQA